MPACRPPSPERRTIALRLAAAAFAAAGLAGSGRAGQPLRVVTEEFPPYNLTRADGRISGFSTEVVEAVLAEVGERAAIQSMPWARAYDIALAAENVLIYSITRTAEREPLFKWIGVIAPSEWSLYAVRGSDIVLSRLDDARRYQIATVNQDAVEQYLASRGFSVGRNLQSSNRHELNLAKLRSRRVDLWIANDLVARSLVRQAGEDPSSVLSRVLPVPELGGEGLYMAFSRRTPDATVERFRRGLDAIRHGRAYDELKARWL